MNTDILRLTTIFDNKTFNENELFANFHKFTLQNVMILNEDLIV